MRLFLLSIILLISYPKLFSQTNIAEKDETTGNTKLKATIQTKIDSLKGVLTKEKSDPLNAEFTLDTFRIEITLQNSLEGVYNDFAMRDLIDNAASSYDSLLNKYYKKLANKLKPKDRSLLIQTQKYWIAFRDTEIKLFETLDKDDYKGGGTAAALEESSVYLDLVKRRTINIFNYYERISNGF